LIVASPLLHKLCEGVRAIAPGIEVRIKASEGMSDQYSIMVVAGAAILLYTDYLPLEESLAQACSKLASISSRMMAAVRPPHEAGSSTEPAPPPSGVPLSLSTLDLDPDSEK
jgi:hypothetical protein